MANKLTLQTVFEAVDKISGPIKTMKANTYKFSKETKEVFSRVGDVAKKVGAAAGVGALAVGKALYDYAQRGDEIGRNARILGLSAQSYQELGYAAKMADVDTGSFADATKKLNNNLGQLRMRQGSLYSMLSRTNPQLALQLKRAKSTDEAFNLVADAISKETNVQKRAMLAQAAFGKSGQELIPMMDDLAKRRAEARASGSIISDKDIAAASALDENLKRLKASGMAVANQVLGQLAEKLGPLLDRFRRWADVNKDLIAQKIGDIFTTVGNVLDFITKPGVIKGLAAIALGIKAVGVASMILGAGNPLVAIIGGIVALITLIVANWSKITGFFDRLTGGASKRANQLAGEYGDYKDGRSPRPDAAIAPVSPNTAGIESRSCSEYRSSVDLNFGNLPAGTTIRQTGAAPGVNLNLGPTSGGAH
jgi:hypothetical protein